MDDQPICAKCEIPMRCLKNGITVAGKAVPHHVRSGDMFHCPTCENKVVVGLGEAFTSKKPADIYLEDK
ncbi:MAG: hypothetical protein ACTSWQ_03970 [Candidatus Thorarchaeota archaeon]